MAPLINGYTMGLGYGLGLLTCYGAFKLAVWFWGRK